ncbi:unnamed protein product, partial [Gongylonema pulchrum]|uniref:WASH_WAHD domain-containing protein n=1 Tax=Gongylonema pulchrum TaxID=637853 RepID=A0A183F0P5_9BILA
MSVCMVPSEVSDEEAMEQFEFCLRQLLALANEIFGKLAKRLEIFNERLERIKGDVQQNDYYPSVLCKGLRSDGIVPETVRVKRDWHRGAPKNIAAIVAEKQKFYRYSGKKTAAKTAGRQIPENLHSAADLLLFNTNVNVYTDTRTLVDPFDNTKTE